MELKQRHVEFTKRGARVLAIAQEDESEEMLWRMLEAIGGELPFEIASDPRREQTPSYERGTAYLFDAQGRVHEIFPAHRRLALPWDAVLARIDELAQDSD